MNRYTLTSDSHHWWYPTAIAATISAAAITAILITPLIGAQATPTQAPTHDTSPLTIHPRPCYLTRPGWNTPPNWEQPICTTHTHHRTHNPAPTSYRPHTDYLP